MRLSAFRFWIAEFLLNPQAIANDLKYKENEKKIYFFFLKQIFFRIEPLRAYPKRAKKILFLIFFKSQVICNRLSKEKNYDNHKWNSASSMQIFFSIDNS